MDLVTALTTTKIGQIIVELSQMNDKSCICFGGCGCDGRCVTESTALDCIVSWQSIRASIEVSEYSEMNKLALYINLRDASMATPMVSGKDHQTKANMMPFVENVNTLVAIDFC